MKNLKLIAIVIGLVIMSSACGTAKGDSARAEQVPAPKSGYSCFILYDGDGKAVGGNCLKD